jgi:membrane-associated protease RseP (regulator of RpoE activity)
MKLLSMVLAAALVPAAALATPNTNQQNQPQNTGSSGMNENPNNSATRGSTPQQTVEVEAFEWSTGQGRLGLMLMGLTPQLRTYFGAPNKSGLLVAQIAPDSAASRAGVRVGDVITKVDNQNVQSADDVIAATSNIGNGSSTSTVRIHVLRNHKPLDLQATIGTGSGPRTDQSGMNESGQPDRGT